MANDQAIGMMDGAYFTGRKELLDWVNDTLSLNVDKIEKTCTGAVACQLLHAHFPGAIQMSKVNWDAKSDYEYVGNYKLLQAGMAKLKINKVIEIERLCRGKYQDNLEFMQWCKGFCDRHHIQEGYDPVAARAKGKGANKIGASSGRTSTSSRTSSVRTSRTSSVRGSKGTLPPPPEKENRASQPLARRSTKADSAAVAALNEKVKGLEASNNDLQSNIDGLEKERDFYFEKLREIEVLLQTKEQDVEGSEQSELAKEIFKIMYATTEDFVAVDTEGNPIEEGEQQPEAVTTEVA